MALPVYTYGSIPSDSEFNAFLRPAFNKDETEEEFPGSLRRLRDDALSNDPTQIKPRFEKFENELRVTAGNGLTINYVGGIVVLPNGAQQVITPGSIALPNNQTSVIYVGFDGVVAVAERTALPIYRLELAEVTTVSGNISGAIVDKRPRFGILPLAGVIKTLGGTGGQGDYTLTATDTFTEGLYYFRNFTVGNTGVLNINGFAKIFCSGNVTIDGSIVVAIVNRGGAALSNVGLDKVASPGRGIGAGGLVSGGNSYNYVLQALGSGGASANANSSGVGNVGGGGDGGGGLWIEAGGRITVNGSILANGSNASASSGISGNWQISGAGGGSGGTVILVSASHVVVTPTATISVRGGNGTNGVSNVTQAASGGGGGGGGQIILISPTTPQATGATLTLTGGTAGTTSAGSTPILGGGGGGGNGGTGGAAPGGTPAFAGSMGKLFIGSFIALGS